MHALQLAIPFSKQQDRTLHQAAFTFPAHPGHLPFRYLPQLAQYSPQAAIKEVLITTGDFILMGVLV
jgi:hypothetical protein